MEINKKDSVGKKGEIEAKNHLIKNGYKILFQNYSNKKGFRLGEIDIIAEKNNHLYFIEVKSRTISNYNNSYPAESNINREKLYKLSKIATFFIKEHNFWDKTYQFDAISVYFAKNGELININRIENIFI